MACGAILEEFQRQALQCHRTVQLELGPGHAIRCAETPFADDFQRQREELRRRQVPRGERMKVLEGMTRGRARVASKGLRRGASEDLETLPEERVRRDGMYMMGELATARSQVLSLAELHRQVSTEGSALLARAARRLHRRRPRRRSRPRPAEIAIVGAGCLLPGAQGLETFWRNLLDQRSVIREIPPERWDWRLYFDSDQEARDRIYSRWGGFLDPVAFNPLAHGIPPAALPSISTGQLLTLEVMRRALDDAGYGTMDFDREDTSVILGVNSSSDLQQFYIARSLLPLLQDVSPEAWERLPEWTGESFPGTLPNVRSGRVTNRLDLGGVNFTVDAACASSLAALNVAARELQEGRSGMVLLGAVDLELTPFSFLAFSKTRALSPQGIARPFDRRADGIVISEGAVALALKRRVDAERDGDRIYALIQAVAGSSDGKGLSLTAPRPQGQRRALERAYEQAGGSPADIGFYEAHGTGTAVGDAAELETLLGALREASEAESGTTTEAGLGGGPDNGPGGGPDGGPGGGFGAESSGPTRCALGSAKSLLGHTKAAAGLVGVLKAMLACQHRVLPPHRGAEEPLEALLAEDSPVYLLDRPTPWLDVPGRPRRAGVSAFGFGGTNFHAVVEEYRPATSPVPPGAVDWPAELLVVTAKDRLEMTARLHRLLGILPTTSPPPLRDFAFSLALEATGGPPEALRLAAVVTQWEGVKDCFQGTLAHLEDGAALPAEVSLEEGELVTKEAVAFLFPGQGSQYPGMVREAALYLPEMAEAVELLDRTMARGGAEVVSPKIYPPASHSPQIAARRRRALAATEIAQPALAAVGLGLLRVLTRLGVKPGAVAGHSFGEFLALHAAGVLGAEDLLAVARHRGRLMADAAPGSMIAVGAPAEALGDALARHSKVVLANRNSPRQSVLSGPPEAVEGLAEELRGEGINVTPLPVSGAFHSPAMATASKHLGAVLQTLSLGPPRCPVVSNAKAEPYPQEPSAVEALLREHLLQPVDFEGTVESLYGGGARIFVEVGPRNVLGRLVRQILGDRPHLTVALDEEGRLEDVLGAFARLTTAGVPIDLPALFDGRPVRRLDLYQPLGEDRRSHWWVDGGRVWQEGAEERPVGKRRLRDQNSLPAQPLPAVAHRDAATAAPDSAATLAAYSEYQQTMRQFLQLQEKVMGEFLHPTGHSTGHSTSHFTGGERREQDGEQSWGQGVGAGRGGLRGALLREMGDGETGDGELGDRKTGPALSALEPDAAATGGRLGELASISSRKGNSSEGTPNGGAPNGGIQEALTRERLSELLLSLVSAHTGYPRDFLDLEQDIEAELGIDSIRRLSILSALLKRLPESLSHQLQSSVDELSRSRSLAVLIDAVLLRGEVPSEAAEAASSSGRLPDGLPGGGGADASPNGTNPNGTGGNAAAADYHGQQAAGSVLRKPSEDERRASPNIVQGSLPSSEETTAAPEIPADPSRTSRNGDGGGCPRFLLREQNQDFPTNGRLPSLQGLFLITEDALGTAPSVAAMLRALGARAEILGADLLADPEALIDRVRELRQGSAEIRGVVHLAGLAIAPAGEAEPLRAWRRQTAIQCKSLFVLLKACAVDLSGPGREESPGQVGVVLAASLFGGRFGRDGGLLGPGSAAAGAGHGLLGTLESEYPGLMAKVVDFDDSLAAGEMAARIIDELSLPNGSFEVGYSGAQRMVFSTVPAPLRKAGAPAPWRPQEGWVVLITGGARGITAELAQQLAAPGVSMIIVGRNPEGPPERAETAKLDSPEELRGALLDSARRQGWTPAEVEGQVREILHRRQRIANLEELRRRGATVEYRALDVAQEAFGDFLEEIYERYGRLDGVLHGAGVIDDRRIADKDLASFETVFDLKADSTFQLLRGLRGGSAGGARGEGLKWVVLMSSVAGRIGNHGQADYAAANEVMNRLAWRMNERWPETRVAAINWGPWKTTGMASEAVQERFEGQGIYPIEVADGRRFFLDELTYGQPGEVEVVAGRGPWEGERLIDSILEAGALFLQATRNEGLGLGYGLGLGLGL